MDWKPVFADHVESISRGSVHALELSDAAGAGYKGIVFHAGEQEYYHADDREIPFRPVPHFARWTPVSGPGHLLVFRPGAVPKLIRVIPEDYWYETPRDPAHPYTDLFEVVDVGSKELAVREAGSLGGFAYVGSSPDTARSLGIPPDAIEPPALMAALDWDRGYKTAYEVLCLRGAAEIAALGHAAVRLGMKKRLSERELHARYNKATQHLENDLPYGSIIAWDAASATLHYQSKRVDPPRPGLVLLIDAGGRFLGYSSDITRTYARKDAHPVFREILKKLDRLQRALVEMVEPEKPFEELHAAAHRGVASILCDAGVIKVGAEEAYDRGFTHPFLPHGLGHHLGLQVHDIGGRQASINGGERPAPPEHPYLRTTRVLETGHVVTIEPGIYFIPMLLRPFREGDGARAFRWKLIDALTRHGGIRIEDDILVTGDGREDLTRDLVP